jgi:hypothetical protein
LIQKAIEYNNNSFADGGELVDFSDNQLMIMNQNVEVEHHHEELEDILEDKVPVPAWVVAKMETATQNLSDITHYLDGEKEIMEDQLEEEDDDDDEDEMEAEEIENKEVVEPIVVTAGDKTEITKNFTDDAWDNLRGFLKGMEGIDLRDDYTFDYKDEQYEVEPIINSDENGVSNAVFTIFDGDGEEVGEVAYSRDGGKQKFTANSEFFSWNNAKFEDGGFMNNVYAKGGEVASEKSIKDLLKKNNFDLSKFTFKDAKNGNVDIKIDGKPIAYFLKGTKIDDDFSNTLISIIEEEYISNHKQRGLVYPTVAQETYRKSFYRTNEQEQEGNKMEKERKEKQKKAILSEIKLEDGGYFDGAIPKTSSYMSNYAKGGMVVTSVKDIPNFKERLEQRRITYRGLGMGKVADDFYKLAGTSGTRIKVDGKEYFITDEEFDTFSRDADGKMQIRFDAPARKGYADGGFMNGVYEDGGFLDKYEVDRFKQVMNGKAIAKYIVRLQDSFGNKETYVFGIKIKDQFKGCELVPYESLYGGWSNSGSAFSLDNLQVKRLVPNSFSEIELDEQETEMLVNKLLKNNQAGVEKYLNSAFFYLSYNQSFKDVLRGHLARSVVKIVSVEFEIAQKFADGGFMNNVYDKGGNVGNEFDYRLLSRLVSDCDYYLGNGNRSEKHLWAGNVDGQIKKMKELWNGFPKNAKPEWLSMEDILDYEKKMKNQYANGGGLGKKYYVIDAKDAKILSKGFDTEEEAIVEKYKIFEKTNNFFLTQKGVEDVRMKYAKKDIATLIKEENMSMYDTKYGIIHLNYNNGEITIKNNKYDYQKEDYQTIFKGGKDAGLFFIADAYEVEEMAKGGSVKKDWWQTVVNPNEDFNNYDDKKPIDWEVDDFKSWVVSNSDLDGNVDKEVLDVVKMPKSKLTVEYLNKNGSGKNNNEYYKEFGNWQSALYDIFTQLKKDYLFKKERKYILKSDIKTVTVKRNGKEVTYNSSDVLNGAYVLAKGGDMTSKANYVGKNDIVEVELKDGSKVKPANGYWIKKGAEPISSKQEFTSKDLPKDGSEIKITAPKLGNFPEIDLILKYDSKNFRFDIYEDGVKKDVVGEKEVLNNLNDGIYMLSNKSTPTASGKYNAVAFDGKKQIANLSDNEYSDKIESFIKDNEKKGFEVIVDLMNKGKVEQQVYKTSFNKSNETKFSETVTKKGIWGWDATTNVNDFNNYDWRITTFRGSNGKLISSAKGGKYEKGNGYTTFKYTMYDDPYHTLEVSQPSRLTEKVVTEQHEKALAKFKKFMETGTFGRGGKISKFDKLSAKVAKNYEGKPVKSQYQEEYGKYYSKEEAQEVGDKVAGKMKAMTADKKENGGRISMKLANELAKEIRKDGESWNDAKKRAFAQLKK